MLASSLLGRVVHEGADISLVRDGVDSVDFGRVVFFGDSVQRNDAALEVLVRLPHLFVGERRRREQVGLQARVYRASAVIHLIKCRKVDAVY